MRLLITGASGLYGSKLASLASSKGFEVYSGYNKDLPTYGTPIQFDVSKKDRVVKTFKQIKPEIVVHAATLTDVDRCEIDKKLAWKINVEGTRYIAEETKKTGSFLLYISTDYVFNGNKGAYVENSEPDPINYYGFTKLKAEEYIKTLLEKYCIARTSVIFGSVPATGKVNFALWILNKLKRNEKINVITDQWNSPTLNTNLAEMTLEIIKHNLIGVFHLSGATRISRYDFSILLSQIFSFETNLINPITSKELTMIAKRPKDSSLNISKAKRLLKNKPLQIHSALKTLKQELTHSS